MADLAAVPQAKRKIREYTEAGGATYKEGAVMLSTAGTVNEAGTDPALILGFAVHDATRNPEAGKCLVFVAGPGATFWLQGDNNPVAGDRDQEYGLTKDGTTGVWYVDGAKTGAAARVHVHDVDLVRNLYEVSVLAANRQLA